MVDRQERIFACEATDDETRYVPGIHRCLGRNLARAELEIALCSLVARLPGLRLAAPVDEIPFKPGDTIQGMLELPVTW